MFDLARPGLCHWAWAFTALMAMVSFLAALASETRLVFAQASLPSLREQMILNDIQELRASQRAVAADQRRMTEVQQQQQVIMQQLFGQFKAIEVLQSKMDKVLTDSWRTRGAVEGDEALEREISLLRQRVDKSENDSEKINTLFWGALVALIIWAVERLITGVWTERKFKSLSRVAGETNSLVNGKHAKTLRNIANLRWQLHEVHQTPESQALAASAEEQACVAEALVAKNNNK